MEQAKPSRTAERRTLFLSAILGIGQSASQCRLRNLTESGARVECGCQMAIGSTVIIARGDLSVAGEVKWSKGTQFGMKFSEKIDIETWLVEPFGNVDSSHKPVERPLWSEYPSPNNDKELLDDETIITRVVEELHYVSRIVESVGTVLVGDPLLKLRHTSSLQQLDLSQQMLAELAQIVSSNDKVASVSQIATGPMRGRILRAKPI